MLCAVATAGLAAAPFLAQSLVPGLALPMAVAVGLIYFLAAVFWRRIVAWAYGRRAAPEKGAPNLFESIDQRFWSFVIRSAHPAFAVLGVTLPLKFYLDAHPLATVSLQVSGIGLVVVVAAWFAPLWVNDV